MTLRLVIAGAGGFGREILGQVHTSPEFVAKNSISEVVFIDDGSPTNPGAEVVGTIVNYFPQENDVLLVALGEPKHKKTVSSRLKNRGARFVSFVHDRAFIGPRVTLGEGSVVCLDARITADVTLEKFVTINVNALIGHDVTLGDYSTVGPSSDLTGGVIVGSMVFIGVAASFRPGVSIGDGARVGMGSVVVRNVLPEAQVFGNPAVNIEMP